MMTARGTSTDTPLIPPMVNLGPEVDVLRAEVRDFLAEELAAERFEPHCDAWLSGWDAGFSRRLGERGWLGMTIPREYGGHGRSSLERYAVTEELLAAGAPVAAHWVADRQTAPSLLRYGSDALKRRYLPAIARGECFFAIGLSEPDAGSDLAAVRTRAVHRDGGWELNGTKVWTSGAHQAHAYFVLARSSPIDVADRHAGLSQFLVGLSSPGVTVRPIRMTSGEHHFNEVLLDSVFVPDDAVIGAIGAGWQQVTSELAFERSGPERFLSTFPLLVAVVDHLSAKDIPCDSTRELGELIARLWTLRQMSLAVAGALAGGEAPDVAAALVKDLGTRLECDVIDTARLLVHTEPDLSSGERLPRLLAEAVAHAPGFTLRGGTNEILRGVVARALGMR